MDILKKDIFRISLNSKKNKNQYYSKEIIRENIEMYSMLLPVLILIFIFLYVPIYGVVIAFQDYLPGKPFLSFDGSIQWVGFKHFLKFINSIYFGRLIKNTLVLSGLNLIFGFWIPILFALIINEITRLKYKKFVQTASYLPYFISKVIVAGLVISFTSKIGIVNNFLSIFGVDPQNYMLNAKAFPIIYTITNVWSNFGFESILYFATISTIDPCLYEATRVDGGNRLHQAWYITLPGLKNVIAIKLILAVGHLLTTNKDLILLLYTNSTYETADVIETYVYRLGIEEGLFSYTAAIGFFMAIIGFSLTFVVNKISNRLTGSGLW